MKGTGQGTYSNSLGGQKYDFVCLNLRMLQSTVKSAILEIM